MGLHLMAASSPWWSSPDFWWAFIKMAVGLGTVIFVHELGHFLVAKWCGVKCEKFYVGFDFFDIKIGSRTIIPRALMKFRWGETEYGIGIIPLGGYVKMLGQDDNPANAEREAERIRVRKAADSGNVFERADDLGGGSAAAFPTRDLSMLPASSESAEGEFELDPRSYQAKSVPQRMAIISAGVIMNLIFAVIFATVAYRVGVSYIPCEVGATVPGDPAWLADLRPGDRILQIGRSGQPSEHLRFDWDLRNWVGLAGDKQTLEMLVRRRDGSEQWLSVRPKMTQIEDVRIPTIGITSAGTTVLSSEEPVEAGSPAEQADPPFKGGDRIVALDGPSGKLDIGDWKHDPNAFYELQAAMARRAGEELIVTVERKSAGGNDEGGVTREDIRVAPNHMKRIGVVMHGGAINGIRPDSPAAAAGFREGDRVLSVGGVPLTDGMSLPHLVRPHYGKEVEIEVARGGPDAQIETVTLRATPQAPDSFYERRSFGSSMSDESLGIAYPIDNVVDAVTPGSPADKAGLMPGDLITSVQFKTEVSEGQTKPLLWEGPMSLGADSLNWPLVYNFLQRCTTGSQIELTYKRGDSEHPPVSLGWTYSDELNPDRGFELTSKNEIHKAETLPDSLALGVRQTREDIVKVLRFLQKLVSGGIPLKHVGGPGTIAMMATSEAQAGTSRLLIFLTFLSANLAVINFLPIPVLDGGHMMFLAAEGLMGRPLNEKWLFRLTIAGFAFILSLMLIVIGMDVMRYLPRIGL